MVRDDDGPPPEARPPLLADLIALCRSLNREGARYIVIGGMAIIQAGFVRATEDIDLLLDGSAENVARVKRALLDLPDQAVREMAPEDVDKYTVVRVADELVVDLLKTAGGVSFGEAASMVDLVTLEGVSIPFANAAQRAIAVSLARDISVPPRRINENRSSRERLMRTDDAELVLAPNRVGRGDGS